MSSPFGEGEVCLLIDARGRQYLLDLDPGRTFQYHAGSLRHEEIIGCEPGTVLRSTTGSKLIPLRPRLADYVLKMERGAQVVYPKDLGSMIHWGDVAPGQLVVDAGTGSGALAMALLRAVGPGGRVISVERRPDHLSHARKTIARLLGGIPENLELVEGDVAEEVSRHRPDRVMLDIPEPWDVVSAAGDALEADGILCVYLPTVPQVQRLVDALQRSGRFTAHHTFENLIRDWRVDGRSVRPDNTMVGHTGFITTSRIARDHKADDPAEAGS